MPWAQDRQGQKVVPSRAWKNHPGNSSYLNRMLKLGVVDTEPVPFRCYPAMCHLFKKPSMNCRMHLFLFCFSKIMFRKEKYAEVFNPVEDLGCYGCNVPHYTLSHSNT